jgi:hypothetical protein
MDCPTHITMTWLREAIADHGISSRELAIELGQHPCPEHVHGRREAAVFFPDGIDCFCCLAIAVISILVRQDLATRH